MASRDEKILAASAKHPKPEGAKYGYGTAGFRMKAEKLDSVVFRVGLLAVLRSKKLNGQTIGVMITASHNPPEDNGVKLVDPLGEMLESSWEAYATQLANAEGDQALLEAFADIAQAAKVKLENPAKVVFARDTRASGPSLVRALGDALEALDVPRDDRGWLTTPQLHYIVRCLNTQDTNMAYGEPTEAGYYKKMANAFTTAMKHRKSKGHVTVDCANGVGGPMLTQLLKYIPKAADGGIDVKIVNDDVSRPEMLNVQCGADFVKTQQRAPPSSKAGPMDRCASLDGDADRLVYYYMDEEKHFHLLDGDKIATMAAMYLGELGRSSGISEQLRIGIVQTAYANGASTAYVEKTLKLPVECTATGVKHLHHAAQRFDIGVYFEANGHGTVLFSPQAQRALRNYEPKSPAQQASIECLVAFSDLINQAVGDALSDLLMVEVILAHKGWTMNEWATTYNDLPNRLVRVEVPDRNVFTTTDAERKLVTPAGMQDAIDQLVPRYNSGRSFVRASGTEDAVRVYAEALTRGETDDLANKVADMVRNGAP